VSATPYFMDGLMPLASLPTQIAGRTGMMRENREQGDSRGPRTEHTASNIEARPRAHENGDLNDFTGS
jgi:hypothetical protein